MAVPKKRTSRSKKKIRKNVRKGKKHIGPAIKAFSLAKSISTGHSKSFYCIVNDDSSGSSESKLTAFDLDDP
uniref:Large ribosomal subunit protein bL32c n=1 Tax=Pinus koraiensis TaxID=88728 RepID=RK32_PINKO|nr:ribosomal protein L32 [Pinus koraiensis]Q85WV0.1 RecName: Full=Large ribosomal subunit protein bL32c; AltName: Full=50S ribosomal protein L32, chloroplastic [Pinus koraiensis]AAO74119.1 ribosomal protein L32 [Pinus koraiensis]